MYETIKRLYDTGRLSEAGVERAVKKGWITEDQASNILGGQMG